MSELTFRLSEEDVQRIARAVAAEMREPVQDRWLTTDEAADYLSIHPVTLRKLAAERRVPFEQERPGCALHFRQAELDGWRWIDNGGILSTRQKRPRDVGA